MRQNRIANKCGWVFRKLLSYFPAAVLMLALFAFIEFVKEPGVWAFAKIPLIVYGIPVLTYRVVSLFAPIKEGFSYIEEDTGYPPWLGAFKLQQIFNAFPFLESGLRLIPGAYSMWLRLWGSKVGKDVGFTPHTVIIDRTNLEFGDYCFIGNQSYLSPHLLRLKNGRTLLYVKTIRIGKGAFVGFASRIGPGVTIADGVSIPAGADLYPDQVIHSLKDLRKKPST